MRMDSFAEATEARYKMYKAVGFIAVDEIWADAKTDTPPQEWETLEEGNEIPHARVFYVETSWRQVREMVYKISVGMKQKKYLGSSKYFNRASEFIFNEAYMVKVES